MNQLIHFFESLAIDWRWDMRANTFAGPMEYMESLFPGTLDFVKNCNPNAVAEPISSTIARQRLVSWMGGIPSMVPWESAPWSQRQELWPIIADTFLGLVPDAQIFTFGGCNDKSHDYAEEGFIMLFGLRTVAALYFRADS